MGDTEQQHTEISVTTATNGSRRIGESIILMLKKWFFNKERLLLFKWSTGFFTIGTIITIVVALRYFSVYRFPTQLLGIVYTIAAFVSHFGSILFIVWAVLIVPVVLLFPFRKVVIPLSIITVAATVTLVVLDSQLFMTRRFHFTFLTIRIFGAATWGFGLLYLLISIAFTSFVAKLVWERLIIKKKKLYPVVSLLVIIILLLFTHVTHIWADATGYVPVTRFTSTLPLFYPSTNKKQMLKMGLVDLSNRRGMPSEGVASSDIHYPLSPLSFKPSETPLNILLIAIDGMRNDVMIEPLAPECMKFAQNRGVQFTNHWSGGNSSKMGCFSLFYGIPPTYEKYFENNKRSPLFIDRLLEEHYGMGIFTSYRMHIPATLDITVFVKVPNLRLETKLPGPHDPTRNDSAITGEWKAWLDTIDTARPFFGFLFYDALLKFNFPPSYASRVAYGENSTEQQKNFARYKVSVMYVDSLVGSVVADLEKRGLLEKTIVLITADHGLEFDDNGLGFVGHGSSFSDYQLRVPLIVSWPGKAVGVKTKRTSHNDIVTTLMSDALGCTNKESDYSSGVNLFSDKEWDWHIVGSYFNCAIIEPNQVTIQFPGGYYECRDHHYQILPVNSVSPKMADAFMEMGRFYRK